MIQSDSSNCNFWEELIVPEIGLFHGIRSFYPRNPESYAAFRLSGRHVLRKLLCSKIEISKAGIYIQKDRFQNFWNIYEDLRLCN